jgi:hypothetical protein
MKDKAILSTFVYLAVGVITACSGSSGKTQQDSSLSAVPSPSSTATQQPTKPQMNDSLLNSPIRKVDFSNFTFPKLPSGKCSMQRIHLINGRYDHPDAPLDRVPPKGGSIDCWSVVLTSTNFGDVTGDGGEEAVVTLYAELGGNSSYSDVFIYTLVDRHPVLLWKFMTGDRADGGLRRIYSENGELVIELYGVNTIAGKQLDSSEGVGSCCPKHYTRTRYKWDGKHFEQVGKEEVFPNPSGSTETLKSGQG